MLVYPAALLDYIGFALVVATVLLQKLRAVRVEPAARL